MSDEGDATKKKGLINWLKGFGLAAFLFFLVKGLAWLAIFWFGTEAIFNSCN
jgi:hypothetical protein